MTDVDRLENQLFLIRDLLMEQCGQTLTPALIETLCARFAAELIDGSMAWAFRAPSPDVPAGASG